MNNNYRTSDNREARDPRDNDSSKGQNLPESELALDGQIAQNSNLPLKGGFEAMGTIPDKVPSRVDLYVRRFTNSYTKDDLYAVIDDIWREDCPLSFDDKLEAIRQIITCGEFDVDSYQLFSFQACQHAVRKTCYQAHLGDVNRFLIDNLESMNYPATKTTIDTCLLGVKEAKETIERILDNSTEWEIIEACQDGLRSIYRKYFPDEMCKVDFDVADRADPETKRNPKRANTIEVITVTEEMQDEWRKIREAKKNKYEG